jgi:SAM-dependent methyltransferase
MSLKVGAYSMSQAAFEWKSAYWQAWREAASPYRQFKSERDRALALDALQLREGDRVLEVGCGYGWVSKALLEAAKIQWYGIDPAESMIRQLRLSLDTYRPCAIVGLGGQLPFGSGSFDKVLCTGVLMHVPDDLAVLREMDRVLRPGGVLLCSMNNALSPFSWIEWLRNRPKRGGFVQRYRLPGSFRRYFEILRLKLLRDDRDGLLSIGAFRLGRFWFPPSRAFPTLRRLDSWLIQRFSWLAHEVWFTAIKVANSESL